MLISSMQNVYSSHLINALTLASMPIGMGTGWSMPNIDYNNTEPKLFFMECQVCQKKCPHKQTTYVNWTKSDPSHRSSHVNNVWDSDVVATCILYLFS